MVPAYHTGSVQQECTNTSLSLIISQYLLHVAHTKKLSYVHKKERGGDHLGVLCVDGNIKMYFRQTGCEDVDWTEMSQDPIQ
jgi:hypothetical protein